MTFTSTTVTGTAISTAAASYPSIATTAAGAVFFLLPRQAVVTVLAATVAGGEVIASRGVSAQFVCYDEPLRKGTDQAPYVSARDP